MQVETATEDIITQSHNNRSGQIFFSCKIIKVNDDNLDVDISV